MKLIMPSKEQAWDAVAPRVGAWIETYSGIPIVWYMVVAPRVGAWIETEISVIYARYSDVAPRVGAWIETA